MIILIYNIILGFIDCIFIEKAVSECRTKKDIAMREEYKYLSAKKSNHNIDYYLQYDGYD